MRKRPLAAFAICATLATAALPAQSPVPAKSETPIPDGPVIGATTQEVLLDVVVRDKKGRMVRNLRAGDLEVFDDGVLRKLNTFRVVESVESSNALLRPNGSVPVELSRLKGELNLKHEARLVTLVFDQLLPAQRPNAKRAALELLKSPGENLLYAVFRIDHKLALLEAYTNDLERIKSAIERATDPSFALNIDEESRIAKNQATAALAEQLLALKTASAASGQIVSTDQRITQMTLNMLQFADAGEQKQQSRAQLLALWALVREQKQLPGRKTVVYFTGGMNIPPEEHDRFNAIVADANLANVTVYAIHAGGVSTYLANSSGNALLEQATASSHANMIDRTGFVSVDQAQVLDRADESVHENAQNSLDILTQDTGGFFAADTNDFRGPVRRVMEEVNFHYELTYSPGIEKYDGHLRRIQVKVAMPDASADAVRLLCDAAVDGGAEFAAL